MCRWRASRSVDGVPRREFHEALLEADGFEDLLGKWQAAILAAEENRPKLRGAGLRIGEALALRWGAVDLLAEPPQLNIARTGDPTSPDPATGERGVEVAVKTEEEGSVTIGERLLRELLDRKAAAARAGDDDLVFPSRDGTHLNPSNLRTRVFAKAVEAANAKLVENGCRPIPADLTPHGLRHTFCSLLVAQGEDVATVAAQMRHADLTTTLRYYTHAQEHLKQVAAARFDAAVWGPTTRIPVANRSQIGP